MTKILSSQRHVDESIVAEKRADADYAVTVSPVLSYDDEEYVVVLDGHHSLEAARRDGVEPEYIVADSSTCDYLHLAESDPEEFLNLARIDSDYYDVETGVVEW